MLDDRRKKNRKTMWIFIGVAIVMLGVGYAMVPFYNALCKTLGLNGKTNKTGVVNNTKPDLTRSITVHLVTTLNAGLKFKFVVSNNTITVHPGENNFLHYDEVNETGGPITVQAIPSITPGLDAKYFKKIECFCFKQQHFKTGEEIKPHVLFFIDPAIPKDVKEMTLSYTLFKTPNQPSS